MIKTVQKIVIQLLKILALIFLLSFERVIGLPFLFTLLSLIWLDSIKIKNHSRPLLILLFSFLMAVFYHGAWLITLFVWLLSAWGISVGGGTIKGKKRRFILIVVLQNLVWLWWLDVPANFVLIAQLIISYILVVMWLRVFKKERRK
ncbi:MAG: hypothetical protein XD95_0061 [Microgenomates bacterium 39_7]|nr:MAG: hypothetical protein XD95_0061 [Microgenomates bacterium 39_7]